MGTEIGIKRKGEAGRKTAQTLARTVGANPGLVKYAFV